ncbi:lipase family protein [Amycolatopsis eburnea]|uniref:Triacylglycerol lipase n=1 Tax=Amycolatopsis eburnea TaxID=2267691 RepID=A0A3R9KNJ9_9PSEU|nr:lipase family protein [Amycolatopsis eburnea]RSD20845.1 triacylglycerol lipase [Amycolatopsis eburnea]
MRRLWTVLLAVVLVSTVAGPATAAEPPQGPAGDAFYTPPSPLPAGADGDVVWWRPLPDQSGARGYLVLYRSRSATDAPIAVSGRVLVPTAPWAGAGPRPIVSVASGTRGIGDRCAPSKFQPDYEKPLFVDAMLSRGWAVAITDYEGLGTPGLHTYVVGRSEGHTVIDAARAATRLPAAGLAAGGPIAFSGYSQGGGGAAWAGELAPSYAPELTVAGITAGGTPADLDVVAKSLDGGIGFGFLLLSALGLDAAYPELDLPAYLNDRGRTLYTTQQDACVDAVFGYAFGHIADYTTANPLATAKWQARLAENKLGARPPKAPVFLFHGSGDEIIPLSQAQTLRSQYCAAGVPVTWGTYLGEHVTTLAFSAGDVVGYLADRFAGKPARSNC